MKYPQRNLLACSLLAGAVLAFTPASPASAQVLRGTARVAESERPLDGARITAMLPDGRTVGSTVTDEEGRFHLVLKSIGRTFVLAVNRIGIKPTTSGTITASAADTLEIDLSIVEEGIATDTIKVTATPALNEIRLREAQRRGWKVFPPSQIAQLRDRSKSFEDLLRSTGYPGLILSNNRAACIRLTRTNRCVLIVLDGIAITGSYPLINPRDIYFMALLTPNQASMEFGDKGFDGAIVIHTRAYGDRYDDDRSLMQ